MTTVSDGACRVDRRGLATDLRALGLVPAHVVLVLCSMKRLGWVEGGPAALASAILDVVGPDATLVVPTQTTINSVTSRRFQAATRGMNRAQVAEFEALLPGFDINSSPSESMRLLSEHIRCHRDSVRSNHPLTSFAARGPQAAELMAAHDLDCHLGERSPLARLYTDDAAILLLGVGYDACTALHLAEYRMPRPPPRRPYRCYVVEGGRRVRKDFLAIDLDDSDFGALGECLDGQPFVRRGHVGAAPSMVMPLRHAVDFAVGWLAARRAQGNGAPR
jgi:aminoglycoside 3-N-acetyltransferase